MKPPGAPGSQSTYSDLLSVIEEMGREIRPTYAGSKSAMERLKRGTEPGGGPLCTSPPPQPGPRCLTSCPPPPHFRDHPRAGAGAGVLGRDRAQRPHVTAAPRPPRAPPVAPQERGHPRGSPPPPNPPAFINKGRAASPPLKGNSPSKEKKSKNKRRTPISPNTPLRFNFPVRRPPASDVRSDVTPPPSLAVPPPDVSGRPPRRDVTKRGAGSERRRFGRG